MLLIILGIIAGCLLIRGFFNGLLIFGAIAGVIWVLLNPVTVIGMILLMIQAVK